MSTVIAQLRRHHRGCRLTSLRYLPGRAAPAARAPQHPRPRPARQYATMALMTDLQPDWRQRKKAATRDRIRASALQLFREQGYDRHHRRADRGRGRASRT